MAWTGKDPSDVLDYELDWTAWLSGDTIASSSWSLIEGSVTLSADTHTDTATTVWVSGGTLNEKQVLQNEIVTAGGRTRVDRVALSVAAAT